MKKWAIGAAFISFILVFLALLVLFLSIHFLVSNEPSFMATQTTGEYLLLLPEGSPVYLYMRAVGREMLLQVVPAKYLNILLAIMQQESGGNAEATGGDIMQASESIDGNLGNITSAEESIKQGVSYFGHLIEIAQELNIQDIRVIVQSYNYGAGFLAFAKEHGGVYSEEISNSFRQKMQDEYDWYGYGDPDYVAHVFRYLNVVSTEGSPGVFRFPIPTTRPYLSYGFGSRIHPLFGSEDFHKGLDFLAKEGTPIYSSIEGEVSVVRNESMGLCVITRLENISVYYMHLSATNLEEGELVQAGTIIGLMGNTGYSTESHLHFQVEIDGTPIDPLPFFSPDDYDR